MQLAIRSTVLRKIVESIPFVKRCWVGLVCRAWPPRRVGLYLSLEPVTEADYRRAHVLAQRLGLIDKAVNNR